MEIHIDILRAVAEGRQKPTRIMYRANLAWTRLRKYLDFLIDQNLLRQEEIDGSEIFSLAKTGKEVLAYYRRIEYEIHHKTKAIPSEVQSLAR